MIGANIIWIFNPSADKVLMCKRHKEPYTGLYSLVGGKIEEGEDGLTAAYRELREETGIVGIELAHLMTASYILEDSYALEVYVGKLRQESPVKGDAKGLTWIDVTEDFTDITRFAGHGLLWHIHEQIKINQQRWRLPCLE